MVVKKEFADNSSYIALSESHSACLEVKVKAIAAGYESRVSHHHRLLGKSLLAVWVNI